MKRILVLLIVLVAVLGITTAVGAVAPPNWDVSGTWEGASGLTGNLAYPFVMTITQDSSANVTGTIVYPYHSITRAVTGTVEGDEFSFRTEGGGYWADCSPCTVAIDGASFHGYGVDSGGSAVEFLATGDADFLPTGEITKPAEGELVWGMVDLEAIYNDDDPNGVQWAVRRGTCDAGTNTVAGNVDGKSTPYTFVDGLFSSTVDTSSWPADDYCFIFNPRETGNEPNMRLTRWFVVTTGYVYGGGQILEGEEGAKQKDMLKISFGGGFYEYGGGYVGDWQINFHNVGDDAFDKANFHATDIFEATFYEGNSATCNDAVNFKANGTLNGEAGYWMWFRAGDLGSPNTADTVRVTLYDSSGIVYDTHAAGEFTDESSCVGSARTGLDAGNITIINP